MTGVTFLLITLIPGISLLGLGGILGLRRSLDAGQREDLRLLLELSLFTVLFTLLPLALSAIFHHEPFVWRMASLALGVFLFVHVGRSYYKINVYGMRWPFAMISLLVLSAILLTIEIINVLWWAAAGAYIWGVLWMLTLSGIQFIAFVLYDRNLPISRTPVGTPQIFSLEDTRPDYRVPDVLRQRVQRDHATSRADGTANNYPHTYRDPVSYARRERYANRVHDATKHHRRGIANTSAGINRHASRR